jgi:hypothetical protein
MAAIDDLFATRQSTPHNINEHMATLRHYGRMVDEITEFGVETGFSTTAFLAARPKRLVSYEINRDPRLSVVFDAAPPETEWDFHTLDCLTADVAPCDLLFIDTFHNYRQLKEELRLHGNKARKFLIFHDTETFKYCDQTPTSGPQGLVQAIAEFLEANPHWQIREHFAHQCGLTILERENDAG